MCGRFTDLYTWDQIYAYYNLIGETPTIWGPNFNVCPTDPVGMILLRDGKRRFDRVRWGLVPYWWMLPDQFDAWLDGSAGKEMLVPAPQPAYVAHACYWTRGAPVWDDYRGIWVRPRVQVCN